MRKLIPILLIGLLAGCDILELDTEQSVFFISREWKLESVLDAGTDKT